MGINDSDHPETAQVAAHAHPSRRTVLRGAGVVGAAAAVTALAACGSSAGGNSTPTTSSTASKDLGATSAIPVSGGKIFTDQNVVVTQPVAGTFKAFSATCTHMGCQVGSVSDGTILCPCHGSEYSVTDGSVKRGPASRALAPATITVANGDITLA